MATFGEERRTTRDRVKDVRTRYDDASGVSKTIGVLIGLALIAFIVYMLFAAANPRTTGDAVRQTPPSPQTTITPRTTTTPSNTTTTPAPTPPATQPK